MTGRLIRTYKIFRFLPRDIKESLFPKQIELPRVMYHHGTLYLYYIIRNRYILVIREPVNIDEVKRIESKSLIEKTISETVQPSDYITTDIATLQELSLAESLSLSDLINYVTANRIGRWYRDYVGISVSSTVNTFTYVQKTISELITLADYIEKYTATKQEFVISESVPMLDYESHSEKELKFWFFRDRIIVLDGVYGGYPSPEYPGKMQYFRVVTDKVFPILYDFQIEEKVRETESETESILINEIVDISTAQVVRPTFTEVIGINEVPDFKVIARIQKIFTESVQLSDVLEYVKGKVISQSINILISTAYIEHPQVIDYITQNVTRAISTILIEHPQVIDYITQNVTKLISRIELGHTQQIIYTTQSITKEVATITLSP